MKLFAALIGIAGALAVFTPSAKAASPSFKCTTSALAKRNVDAEWTICSSNRLARLDREMAAVYRDVKGQLNWRAASKLRRTQLAWLDHRNACGESRSCIARKYRQRIRQLNRYETCFDHTARPGCVSNKLARHSDRWERRRAERFESWRQRWSDQVNSWSNWGRGRHDHLNGWKRRDISYRDRF